VKQSIGNVFGCDGGGRLVYVYQKVRLGGE
jgi:hypothetical protein